MSPTLQKMVSSFITEMMIRNNQTELAKEKAILPFEVQVLKPIRTICEKLMSLVRFSYGEDPIKDLRRKIRHTYDLHQLLQQPEFSNFFNSSAFDEMLLKVAHDDVTSFRNNNAWLNYHPKDALLFRDLEYIWPQLKSSYEGEFRDLVFGSFPSSDDILKTLTRIKERFTTIIWTVKVDHT